MSLILLLTACSGALDATAVAVEAKTPVAPVVAPPAATVEWVNLDKADGPLDTQFATQAKQAWADGQVPVAYLGARWCAPCKAFKKQKDDPAIVAALDGVRILELDVDAFMSELEPAGVQVVAIPHWFPLDAAGDPVNGGMSGDKWTDLSPASMAPSLATLRSSAAPTQAPPAQ